jgi:WD40 repeat protein
MVTLVLLISFDRDLPPLLLLGLPLFGGYFWEQFTGRAKPSGHCAQSSQHSREQLIKMDLGKDWFENDVKPYERFTNAHENSIEAVVFNPANNIEIASGSHDKSIKLWDIQKFKQTTKLTGHTAGVWALAFSMDGKVLLSGSPDKTILVWDPKKAKPLAQLKDHPTKV